MARAVGQRRTTDGEGNPIVYRPVGYRTDTGAFAIRRPGNGHWWTSKGSHRAKGPTPADLLNADVVNWQVTYGGQTYYFSAEGGVTVPARGAQREWNTDDLMRDFLEQQLRPTPPGGPHRRRTPVVIQNPDGTTSVTR